MALLLLAGALAMACTCDEAETLDPGLLDGAGREVSTGDGPRTEAGSLDGASLDQRLGDGKSKDKGPLILPFCRRTCKTTDDCCAIPPCTTGEKAQTCQAGRCVLVGCSASADCTLLRGTGQSCKTVTDPVFGVTYGRCAPFCSTDADCTSPQRCVGILNETKDRICGTACTQDTQCLPPLLCLLGAFCGSKYAGPCKTDADCSPYQGLSRCDAQLGRCYCADHATCQGALSPTQGGTWRCL